MTETKKIVAPETGKWRVTLLGVLTIASSLLSACTPAVLAQSDAPRPADKPSTPSPIQPCPKDVIEAYNAHFASLDIDPESVELECVVATPTPAPTRTSTRTPSPEPSKTPQPTVKVEQKVAPTKGPTVRPTVTGAEKKAAVPKPTTTKVEIIDPAHNGMGPETPLKLSSDQELKIFSGSYVWMEVTKPGFKSSITAVVVRGNGRTMETKIYSPERQNAATSAWKSGGREAFPPNDGALTERPDKNQWGWAGAPSTAKTPWVMLVRNQGNELLAMHITYEGQLGPCPTNGQIWHLDNPSGPDGKLPYEITCNQNWNAGNPNRDSIPPPQSLNLDRPYRTHFSDKPPTGRQRARMALARA